MGTQPHSSFVKKISLQTFLALTIIKTVLKQNQQIVMILVKTNKLKLNSIKIK